MLDAQQKRDPLECTYADRYGMLELSCAALLFDMDGVLVDSQAVVKRTWRRWCERTGVDEVTVLRAAHGRRTMDTLQTVAPHLDLSAELRWLEEAELDDDNGIVAIPGASHVVVGLPLERWAVVTSAGRELAIRRLEWAGLPTPACLVAAEHVNQGKPSPEGYLRAAVDLRVAASSCVVFEDAPAGVDAAKAAGMRIIGLTTTHEPDQLGSTDALLPDLLGVKVREDNGEVVLGIPTSGAF